MVQRKALIKIQSAIRCLLCKRSFHLNKSAAIEVQRFVRGQNTRRRLLGSPAISIQVQDNFISLKKSFYAHF